MFAKAFEREAVVLVCAAGSAEFSSRFREMLSDDLRVFDTREAALAWLAATADGA